MRPEWTLRRNEEAMVADGLVDAVHAAFEVHVLNEEGKAKARAIAEGFSSLLALLEAHCTPGREMAIVLTKLEEAAMFAKKAMAKDPAHQEPQP